MPTAPPLPFHAPGPGTWEMDSEHFSTALPPLIAEVFAAAFPAGMAITAERHGLPLETIACVVVHGFPYMQARPIGAPPGAAEPPAWLLRLLVPVLTRVHPTLRARLATATTLFERRPWRGVAEEWDANIRAATVAAHAAIGEVDLERLDDAGLARHLVALRAHAIAMLTQDHSLNGSLMVPLGDYLVNVGAWTGRSEAELMNALRGSSAISAGDSYERRRLVAALRAEPAARAALDGGASDPIGTLARLTTWPGEVGAATRAWRLITGNTLAIGIDIRHPTADEDPRQLLAALRLTLAGAGNPTRDPAVAAALRAEVPEAHREGFDRLFDDACTVYRLRDERHLYGAMPVLGVGRRAMLAAGRRLLYRGALEQAEDAFLCGVDELVALLEHRTLAIDWPTRRAVYAVRAEQVPARLGPAVGAPDPDVFPAPIARVLRALNAYMRSVSGAADAPAGPDATRTGMAVSRGTCEGTARVCFTVEDLARIEPGDILVAPLTTPAINIVLPILGAIVTDRGGALSHAAIVSREFGIPGVVGVRDATRTIPDGARIRVDGDRGTVTVLG
jgi:phosphohistidine swiveling domain-containing protein